MAKMAAAVSLPSSNTSVSRSVDRGGAVPCPPKRRLDGPALVLSDSFFWMSFAVYASWGWVHTLLYCLSVDSILEEENWASCPSGPNMMMATSQPHMLVISVARRNKAFLRREYTTCKRVLKEGCE